MKRFIWILAFVADLAHATGSTINTTIPAANSALQSAPIRANFAAAASDINGLIGLNNGTSAPASPVLGQLWLNTTSAPYVLNVWDGTAWDQVGTLNASTNKWAVPIAQGGTGLIAAGTTGCVLTSTGSVFVCSLPTNTGTVTSVGLLLPSSLFNVTGSPVTTSGTFAASLQNQTANYVWAGPTSGGAAAPTFRALVAADVPTLNQNTTGTAANVTGVVAAANGGTGVSTCGTIGYVLTWNGSTWACSAPTGGGSVTSVGLSLPLSIFAISGSPVTGSGTLTGTLNTEPANYVWAGPTSGGATTPAFRALVAGDIPALSYAPQTSGTGVLAGNGSGGTTVATAATIGAPIMSYMPSNIVPGSATPTSLGMSTPLSTGGVYSFEIYLLITESSGGLIGLNGGSVTATSLAGVSYSVRPALAPNAQALTSLSTTVTTGTGATFLEYVLTGTITVNAGGTFTPTFASSAAATDSINAGSWMRVTRIN